MKANYIRILLLLAIAIMFISLMGRLEHIFSSNNNNKQISQTEKNNHYTQSIDYINKNNEIKDQNLGLTTVKNSLSKDYKDVSVIINTKVFKNLKVSLLNGSITSASLKDYNISLNDVTPMNLLTEENGFEYIAKSRIVIDKKPVNVEFTNKGIKIEGNKQILTLLGSIEGLDIIRKYTFDDSQYNISISQNITNTSSKKIDLIVDNSLYRNFDFSGEKFSILNAHSYTFTGVAYSTLRDKFRKESFKDISKTNGKATVIDNNGPGWISFLEHYFMTAWIPQSSHSKIYYKNLNKNIFEAGEYTNILIDSNKSQNVYSILYSGPIIKDNLVNLAPNLEKTLDYGMLSFFSEFIFLVMSYINVLVGNWGLSIILVTILIKIIFYPLSAKSYRSMAKMRMLQPRIKRLQETYKNDRKSLGKKMMEMYKEEKVNPLGGCLPMLIQIPIFISLYWVLLESVELRHSPFMFWIKDLSMKDPYFVLPILMGLSMFLQQKISPSPADPMQANIMMFLPLLFTFLFASFPSGLVLYWLTNNLISILQQWFITKHYQAINKK